MKTYCVYRHVFPDGKSYIGMTSNTNRRWQNGTGYRCQQTVDNAIRKFGWENITHEIIADSLTMEEAEKLEKLCIQKYDSITNGYNVSKGGIAIFSELHHTEDAKKRISARLKVYEKSESHRLHISEKKAGVLHHFAKKVYQYSIDGAFIREWEYMNDASKTLHINKGNISSCCLGLRPSAGGYIWSYSRG